jgi:hypothetical protein
MAARLRGERVGGVISERATRGGRRVDVYFASCEGCRARGAEAPDPRAARRIAVAAGWVAKKIQRLGGMMVTRVWDVRCPSCATAGSSTRTG